MITIRPATLADVELIRSLAEVAFPATYRPILSDEQIVYMMQWMYASEQLSAQMHAGHHYLLVAWEEKPCGYCSIEREGVGRYHLHKIYLLPEAQGKGMGKALWQAALNYIRSFGERRATLELRVNRANPALGFYRRMGMQILRSEDLPIGGDFSMNDYIMVLEL